MIDHDRLIAPRSRAPLVLGVATAVFLLLGAAAAVQAYRLGLDNERLASLQSRLERRLSRPARALSRTDLELAKKWDALAQERAFPWNALTRAVEHAIDPDIVLREFAPDVRQRGLTLKGVARDRDAVVRYLQLLEGESALSQVFLVHEADVVEKGTHIIDFEVHAMIR